MIASRVTIELMSATFPGSRMSPKLTTPLQFRTSGIEACDHSECFLFSYDLHRYYNTTSGRPRILMNPRVKVAYEKNWFHWNVVLLRRPMIQWWLRELSIYVTDLRDMESWDWFLAIRLAIRAFRTAERLLHLGRVQASDSLPAAARIERTAMERIRLYTYALHIVPPIVLLDET